MKKNRASNLSFLMLLLVIVACFSYLWQSTDKPAKLDYSQVRQLFEQEKVESFQISDNTLTMAYIKQATDGKFTFIKTQSVSK